MSKGAWEVEIDGGFTGQIGLGVIYPAMKKDALIMIDISELQETNDEEKGPQGNI